MILTTEERKSLVNYSIRLNKSVMLTKPSKDTPEKMHNRITLKGDILFLHIILSYRTK